MTYLFWAIYNIVFALSSMPGISAYHLQYCNNKNIAITLTSDVLLFFLCLVWYILHFWNFLVNHYLHFAVNPICCELIKKQVFKRLTSRDIQGIFNYQGSILGSKLIVYNTIYFWFWLMSVYNSDINVYVSVNSFKLSIDD